MLKSKFKFLTISLVFTFLLSISPIKGFALESTLVPQKSNFTTVNETILNLDQLPSEIKYLLTSNEKNNAISLSTDSFNDLYSFTSLNNDGSKTLYKYEIPIKYKESSKVKFINNELKESSKWYGFLRKYAYENSENSIKTYFPENIKDGILLETDNITITICPVIDNNSKGELVSIDNNGLITKVFQYSNVFDKNISIQYSAVSNGIKENIIIEKYNGINTFHFRINAKGLEPAYVEGESIPMLSSDTKEIAFILGQVDARDSYTGENTENDMHFSLYNNLKIEKTDIPDEYLLSVEVDKSFLESEKTVYPVIIDPPAYVYQGNMLDTTVYNGMPNTQTFYTSSYNIVGDHGGSYGQGITYVQINNMQNYKYINPNKIVSAYYHVREASGKTNQSVIEVHDTYSTWQQNTISYNNQPSTSYYNNSYVNVTTSQWYDFNVTGLVQAWLRSELYEDGGWMKEYGFALKARSSSSSSKHFCSANYSGTLAPTLVINYNEDTSISNGTYFIKSVNSGLYLNTEQNPNANGNCIQYYFHGGKNQQWKVVYQGDGYYKLYSPYYDNTKCLDVENLTSNNIDVYPDGSGDWLLFRIISNNDGTYRIMNKWGENVDKALDVAGGSTAATANVIQYPFYGNNNQKWVFSTSYNGYSNGVFTTPENSQAILDVNTSNNTYNTIPWNIAYEGYYTAAMATAQGGQMASYVDAANLLRYFLMNTGTSRTIDFARMNLQNIQANINMVKDMNDAITVAEYYLNNTSSKSFTTDNERVYSTLYNGNKFDNWYLAIGGYRTWYSCNASKSGNTITMTMTYNMRDFYDWNANGTAEIGLVSQGQMNTLHRAGMAKDYKVTGQMQMRIVWNIGQSIGNGATWTIL